MSQPLSNELKPMDRKPFIRKFPNPRPAQSKVYEFRDVSAPTPAREKTRKVGGKKTTLERDIYVLKFHAGTSKNGISYIQVWPINLKERTKNVMSVTNLFASEVETEYTKKLADLNEFLGGTTTPQKLETKNGIQFFSKGKGFNNIQRIMKYIGKIKTHLSKEAVC